MADEDPLAKAAPPVPKTPSAPYTYYSPEAKRARHEGLVDAVRKRNDAVERLQDQKQEFGERNRYREANTFAKGGKVLNNKSWRK